MTIPRVVTVDNPAAGANWVYTQPAGSALLIVGITWKYDPDNGAAGSRRVGWVLDDGTGSVADVPLLASVANANMAATDVATISAWRGSEAVSFTSGLMNLGLPLEGIYIRPTQRLSSFTNGIQAGDQLSNVRLLALDAAPATMLTA